MRCLRPSVGGRVDVEWKGVDVDVDLELERIA